MQESRSSSSFNFLNRLKMAIASTMATFASVSSPSASNTFRASRTICSRPCPNFFTPKVSQNPNPNPLRLKVCRKTSRASAFRGSIVSCLVDENSEEAHSVSMNSNVNEESSTGATIDLKLPRRSLLVHFTCNSCGERSQKLINRLAYERGTVFIQCSGCLQHHKLVDNLGLVVEYDFREEAIGDTNPNQV